MSKLYLKGRTDKKEITATANDYIDLELYFDESDMDKYLNVRMNAPVEEKGKIILWL